MNTSFLYHSDIKSTDKLTDSLNTTLAYQARTIVYDTFDNILYLNHNL